MKSKLFYPGITLLILLTGIPGVFSLSIDSGGLAQFPLNDSLYSQIDGVLDVWNGNNATGYGKTFYDGTITGASSMDGVVNKALDFDGSADYFGTTDTITDYGIQQEGSICAWVKSDDDSYANAKPIISFYDGTEGYRLMWAADNEVDVVVSGGTTIQASSDTLNKDTYYYICTTWAVGSNVSISVNTQKESSVSTLSGPLVDDGQLRIGAWKNSPDRYFDGKVDEVTIWNKSLSDTKIQELYSNNGVPLTGTGLVSYYTFDTNSIDGTTGRDTNHRIMGPGSYNTAINQSRSFAFDGDAQYVEDGNVLGDTNHDSFTITAWAYPLDDSEDYLFTKLNNPGLEDRIYITKNTFSDQWSFIYEGSNGGQKTINAPLTSNRWQHVVAVKNSTHCKMYINSTIQQTGECPDTLLSGTLSNMTIGKRAGSTKTFNGSISDVRVYNRALSQNEIRGVYYSGLYGGVSALNFSARNYITNETIIPDSIIISSENHSIIGQVGVNYLQEGDYTLYANKSGYINYADTIETQLNVLLNYTANMSSTGDIVLQFRNETDRSIVNNVSFTIAGQSYGLEVADSGGYYNITGLPDGDYEIRYQKSGYTTRSYFFTTPFTNSTQTNITMYLLDDSIASDFTVTVTDRSNRPIANLYASLLRRYVVDGQTQYNVVEMMQPSIALSGLAPFTAVSTEVPYLFRVAKQDGTVLFQGAGRSVDDTETLYLIQQDIFIKVSTSASPFKPSNQLLGLSYNLTNSSNKFWLSYQDTSSVTNQVCLKVYENNTELLYESCSSASSAVLSYEFTPSNGSYYVGKVVPTSSLDDSTMILDVLILDYGNEEGANVFGVMGLFVLLITIITFAVGFSQNPAMAVAGSVFAVILYSSSFLGIVEVSLLMQGTLFVVGMIVAYMVRREN